VVGREELVDRGGDGSGVRGGEGGDSESWRKVEEIKGGEVGRKRENGAAGRREG